MKEYQTKQVRTVSFAGHSGSGTTSLSEVILFQLGFTDRLGRTDDGNTVSDYDPEEIRRKVSINTAVLPIEYNGMKINILDNPGYRDFISEIKNAIRVSEGLIILIDSISGVEVGTEFVWEYAKEFDIPVAFFINKLDKERANFDGALKSIKDHFECATLPLVIPVGQQSSLSGVIDLLKMKKITEKPGEKPKMEDIPADLKDQAEELRAKLIEIAAEGNDELTTKYLDTFTLTNEEVLLGLKEGFKARKVYPVFCGSGYKGIGIHCLLDGIISIFPAPDEMKSWTFTKAGSEEEKENAISDKGIPSAFVFKTVSDPYAGRLNFFKIITGAINSDMVILNPVKNKEEKINHLLCVRGKKQENIHKAFAGDIAAVAKFSVTTTHETLCDSSNTIQYIPTKLPPFSCIMAISSKSKTDEEKIGIGMHRQMEQDPSIHLHRDSEIKQTILSGMGDTQLDVAISRLKTQSGVEVELSIPHVPYRETILKKAEGQHKYKKQTGGRGQYGDCSLRLEPLPRGTGFEFDWAIVGGVIPTKFKPSIEKGIVGALPRGIIAGYPVVDVKASCFYGSYHSVDSSDMAFQIAGSICFRKVAQMANPIILEPIYKLKVIVPEQYMGDILGDLSSKRGQPTGNQQEAHKVVIEALVPLAEMFEYSRQMRSMTQGRGMFEMVFDHYAQVPAIIQQEIVAKVAKGKEEEEEEA